MSDLVHLQRVGDVAEFVFDAPPVNQLSPAFVDELEAAIDGVGDARAVAITSAVPKIFMAGGDIKLMEGSPVAEQGAYIRRLQATFHALEMLELPVVVGIDGAALGGGTEIALACDIRIAAADATMGQPESTLGIFPGGGGTHRLVRSVGNTVAMDLMMSGRRISGEEAGGYNLVSRVVGSGEATAAAKELAAELANGATEALRAIKRLGLASYDTPPVQGFAAEAAEWTRVRESANAQEGLSAFLERRTPNFKAPLPPDVEAGRRQPTRRDA
ncbi:MAG TPA: enoyl-CoA hydratase/isomerase family protein [Solirubrobacterales bacterium]|nr:enoyl-CoA hydratase/isomerase family protein [Solirubrobacterales bacterium]